MPILFEILNLKQQALIGVESAQNNTFTLDAPCNGARSPLASMMAIVYRKSVFSKDEIQIHFLNWAFRSSGRSTQEKTRGRPNLKHTTFRETFTQSNMVWFWLNRRRLRLEECELLSHTDNISPSAGSWELLQSSPGKMALSGNR